MSSKIRIGIVGAGVGASTHLPALQAHPRFELLAIASPHSAAGVAAKRNVPHAFRSCAEMLAGCELDAVTVASPPFAHEADCIEALRAKKHLLCEKPVARNVDEARRILEAAKEAGTACGAVHEFRFVPQNQALREMVVNGHLDPLRNVELTYLRSYLRGSVAAPHTWWVDREKGGGIAGTMLSHMVDLSTWLAGRAPVRSTGYLRVANAIRHGPQGDYEATADDGAAALVDYGDGVLCRIFSDATAAVDAYTCALHAEPRTAVASGPAMADLQLFSVEGDETSELDCKASPYARFASVNANVPPLMELYDQFAKKIAGEPNGLPTLDEALVTQEVLATVGFGK